jgi:uncharacterized membrane protein YbhN (UPF0104 family)
MPQAPMEAAPPAPPAHDGPPPLRTRPSRRRTAFALAGGAVAAAALLAWSGPADVAAALRSAAWAPAAAAFAAYAAFFALRGVRWRLLLGPGGAGAGTAALLTAAGWLASTVLPMKAGDVMRAAWMGRRHRSGVAAASGTVALERLLDLGGLAVLCSAGLLALRAAGDAIPPVIAEAVALSWALPLLGLAAVVVLGLLVTPARRTNALLRFAGRALDQARSLRGAGPWAAAAGLTLATTLAQSLVYAFLVLAFVPGASVAVALAGAPLFLLSFALAFTPAHLGTYEAAFVLVFAALGVAPAAQLLAAAFAVHLATITMVAVLGGASFALLGLSRPALRPLPTPARGPAPGPATPPAGLEDGA